ncbi:MAG: MBL fold metallo-hydrolase [Candidatus Peribacteraceae bacterium]|nr:MBL fold metallo-hydrolase [Candidatus Peribacteraceae bacterium]
MITITSLGGQSLKCVVGKMMLAVFPAGNKAEKGEDTLTLLSHPEEEPSKNTISWPGEYDIGGIFVRGLGHEEGAQVSFIVEGDGVRMAFLSTPLHMLNDHELELIGDVDILCIPAEDSKTVQTLIDGIDPRVLIPLAGKDAKNFAEVLKVCGAQGKEAVDEYKLKGSLPAEGREVVILKAGK